MNFLMICILILSNMKIFQGKSEEYYECLNTQKTIKSSSECTNIKIPDSDEYKCCSMKITFNNESSFNCFPLENKYTESQELLKEYISKRSLAGLFGTMGGQMEIECGNEIKMTENYEKLSDEFLNCYNNHMNGTQNENDCINNDIPNKEGSKCCYIETSTINNNGNIIDDKRCYIIQDEYFTKEKNLSNYLLDESNSKSLDQIINTNVTINCKNYGTYFFNGQVKYTGPISSSNETIETNSIINYTDNIDSNFDKISRPEKEKSNSKTWIIIVVIIACIIFIGIIILIIAIYYKKKKNSLANNNNNKNDITKDNSVKEVNSKTNNTNTSTG